MLRTRLCDLLGPEAPIICAPMEPSITSPELAAAVSNAGGLGIISFGANPPALLHRDIRRPRDLTDRPFGVNFILHFPVEEQVAICLEERVPVLSFCWGDPAPYVERAHAAGCTVLDQVGSVEAAQRSARAGLDAIIAQGFEAGGHVAGKVTALALVPRVVDAVAPTPVIAAGGIADARGLVAALALGAEGIVLGTRLLATPEANAHPVYKQKVLEATEEDTAYTTLFGGGWPDAPHRALRTPFVDEWLVQEARGQEQRPDEPVIGGELRRPAGPGPALHVAAADGRRHGRHRIDGHARGSGAGLGARDPAGGGDRPRAGGRRAPDHRAAAGWSPDRCSIVRDGLSHCRGIAGAYVRRCADLRRPACLTACAWESRPSEPD